MLNLNPIDVLKRGIIYSTDENPIIVDFDNKECQIAQVGIDLRIKDAIVLKPLQGKNVELVEKFNMQDNVGYIWVRSSFSRRLIKLSCGIFDPHFQGCGGVSLYNFGEEEVTIQANTRICQMVIYPAVFAKPYNGFYNQNQTIESQYKV